MKTLCKNRDPHQQIRICNTISIMLLLCIAILGSLMIYDLIAGLPIDGSRCAILCADVSILCLNIKNKKETMARIAEEA